MKVEKFIVIHIERPYIEKQHCDQFTFVEPASLIFRLNLKRQTWLGLYDYYCIVFKLLYNASIEWGELFRRAASVQDDMHEKKIGFERGKERRKTAWMKSIHRAYRIKKKVHSKKWDQLGQRIETESKLFCYEELRGQVYIRNEVDG